MTPLETELSRLASLPEPARVQAKFDLIVSIMQGETSSFAGKVYVSILSSFAIACINIGLDPITVNRQIKAHTEKEIRRLLKDQGITTGGAPRGLNS